MRDEQTSRRCTTNEKATAGKTSSLKLKEPKIGILLPKLGALCLQGLFRRRSRLLPTALPHHLAISLSLSFSSTFARSNSILSGSRRSVCEKTAWLTTAIYFRVAKHGTMLCCGNRSPAPPRRIFEGQPASWLARIYYVSLFGGVARYLCVR